jgi:hypothetical protein
VAPVTKAQRSSMLCMTTHPRYCQRGATTTRRGLAAYSDALHHGGDQEGKSERHHDQPYLHKKRVSFSEHSAALPPMESASAGARKTAQWPSR